MSQSGGCHTSLACLWLGAQQRASGTAAQAHFIGIWSPGKTQHRGTKLTRNALRPRFPVVPSPASPFKPYAECCSFCGLPGFPRDPALIIIQHSARDSFCLWLKLLMGD